MTKMDSHFHGNDIWENGNDPSEQGFMGQAYREGGNEDEKWEENNEIATLSSKVRNDIKAV